MLARAADPEIMARVYPSEPAEARARRTEHLLDLYLNMPNKGHCDTPLHHAAKFGSLEVVVVLAGYSSCDPARRNRDGLTPAEVACTRKGGEDKELKEAIVRALSGQVYIPVVRDLDLGK